LTGSVETLQQELADYADSIPISARTGQGLDELLNRIEQVLQGCMISLKVHLPYTAGHLVSLLHEQAIIETESHDEFGTHVTAYIPKELVGMFEGYQVD
jgi:GTP-binding protein HflX